MHSFETTNIPSGGTSSQAQAQELDGDARGHTEAGSARVGTSAQGLDSRRQTSTEENLSNVLNRTDITRNEGLTDYFKRHLPLSQ